MIPQIVLGANLGDEGKGLTVDYLTSLKEHPAIVRFNGGGQAGHTGETPEGVRHVFSQIGSGVLANPDALTYLSQFFIFYPDSFIREWQSLRPILPKAPRVFVHQDALLTTPFDILINQVAEMHRGENRHGSCGHGINETVVRNLNGNYCTHVSDLLFPGALKRKLDVIRKEYLPARLAELGIPNLYRYVTDSDIDWTLSKNEEFCRAVVDAITIVNNILPIAAHNIIFEGAQGLMLDQDHHWFPHVTRSSTGMKNPLRLLAELAIEKAEIFYVTRAYLTRHGRGPLPEEIPNHQLIYPGIVDLTNIHNPHQETLRFAPLNVDLTAAEIKQDLKQVNIKHSVNLMMTCLDQTNEVQYIHAGLRKWGYTTDLENVFCDELDLNSSSVHLSFGPTRSTIQSPLSFLSKAHKRFAYTY